MKNEIKIHLGCGPRNFGSDWVHIDGSNYDHVDSHDIINLPYEDNSVSLIYASHVFEYFDRQEAKSILALWYRKLKSGGVLRLAVPDFKAMVQLYLNDDMPIETFLGPIYGRMLMAGKLIYHKTAYDEASLNTLLIESGFDSISLWNWRNCEHGNVDDHSQAYIPHMDKDTGTLISLNIEAIKP